jgi:hypothetical protein
LHCNRGIFKKTKNERTGFIYTTLILNRKH